MAHMKHVLNEYYERTFPANVVCLIADNCALNYYRIADLLHQNMIGCCNHRHSLQMAKFQAAAADVVDHVVKHSALVMKKPKAAAELRNLTKW